MILFVLIFILSLLVQLFLPWWSMAAAAFVLGWLLGKKSLHAFLSGFFACGSVWLLMAFYIHFTRGDLMTNRIANLLSLHGTAMLYAGVFLVAAIVGGLASLCGYFLKGILNTRSLSGSNM